MKRMFLLVVLATTTLITFAQAQVTLFESLAEPDSITGATIVVQQDSVMQRALEAQQLRGGETTMRGFRVQVFSSNNARTARESAFKVEKTVREKLPQIAVYVTYTSPFWKVRLGNCATNEDAQRLRQYIIEQLPQFQAETYIVPDQIMLNQ